METLPISVVIPSLSAARTLASTLLAVRSNSLQAAEILVVDGLSEDGTGDIARQFGCTVIQNAERHTAAARQIGVEAAKCQIVAMTDADCLPEKDWLARIHAHFARDLHLGGVGGPVRLDSTRTRVQAYCARKATVGTPEQPEIITQKGMRGRFSGANCAYRRQLVLDAGGYDYRFEAVGEDVDLFWRLLDQKARLLFDPALCLEHTGFAEDYATLARKSFGYGIASARLDRIHFRRQGTDISFLRKPWSAALREARSRRRGCCPECAFVDQLMFGIGRLWEALKVR